MDFRLDNCSAVMNADQRDTDGDGSVNFIDIGLFKGEFRRDHAFDTPSDDGVGPQFFAKKAEGAGSQPKS